MSKRQASSYEAVQQCDTPCFACGKPPLYMIRARITSSDCYALPTVPISQETITIVLYYSVRFEVSVVWKLESSLLRSIFLYTNKGKSICAWSCVCYSMSPLFGVSVKSWLYIHVHIYKSLIQHSIHEKSTLAMVHLWFCSLPHTFKISYHVSSSTGSFLLQLSEATLLE